jgi:hypothetical protein
MEPARKFKIIVNSKECGTCSGATPSAVAKKVVKKLCGTSSKVVKFSLKECKRGCERVCGPYQGRMEKLDKPYKRDGKTITHRVVCGKVRKMRGGRELVDRDFEKREGEYDDNFIRYTDYGIFSIPCIYFGNINIDKSTTSIDGKPIIKNISLFKYAIFNKEHFGKKIRIVKLKLKEKLKEKNNNQPNQRNIQDRYYVEEVIIDNDFDTDLNNELKKLYEDLKKNPKLYNSIRDFIKRKLNIHNNTKSRNAQPQHEHVIQGSNLNSQYIQESESTESLNYFQPNASLIKRPPVNQNNNSDLSKDYFEKGDTDYDFKFVKIGLRPHIFFGETEINNKKYYKLVVFNKEHTGGNKKTCGFNELKENDETIRVVSISKQKIKINTELVKKLKKLLSLLISYTYKNEYKTIRKELKGLLQFDDTYINKNNSDIMNFCLFSLDYGMIYSRYYNNLCNKMNDKLKEIIDKVNNTKKTNGKNAFNKINNLGDLFKRKDGYITEHSYKLKKKLFRDTCYYTAIYSSDFFVIFFSKNINSEYYYLAFVCDNILCIAIYDPDNHMTTIYNLPKNRHSIRELTIYYPSDMIDIFYCCFQCIKNHESKIMNSSNNFNIQKNKQIKNFLYFFE